MERKQHPEAVSESGSSFELVAVVAGPEPDDERRFVMLEVEHVDGILRTQQQQGWFKRTLNNPDGPTLNEWQHYRHKLGSYLNIIDRYEADLAKGIIPFRIDVSNMGRHKDYDIAISVRVANGELLLTRQLPNRPARPAGHQHAMEMPSYDVFSGFRRSDIRIGKHSLSARFSELSGGDEAALVNQTLFIELGPDTELNYELSARRAGTVSGLIAI